MNSLIVRLSVLALATTGFAASTISGKAPVKPAVVAMGTSLPSCGPSCCNPGHACPID